MSEHNSVQKDNEFRIEGRHSVLEAFRAGRLMERLYVQKGLSDGPILSILKEAKKAGTIVDFIPKERLDYMSETGRHQGVLAVFSLFTTVKSTIFSVSQKKRGRLRLFLYWTASRTRTTSGPSSGRPTSRARTALLFRSAGRWD